MKRINTLYVLPLALLSLASCKSKQMRYLPESPPLLFIPPDEVNVAYQSAPPIMMSQNVILTKSITGSQYFKIAIPHSVDQTGRANELRKVLSDILSTELFETKRFNLMDRGELSKVEDMSAEQLVKTNRTIKKYAMAQPKPEDTTQVQAPGKPELTEEITEGNNDSKNTAEELRVKYSLYQEGAINQSKMLEALKNYSDGVLLTYITAYQVSPEENKGKMDIDFRIVSTASPENPMTLFAGNANLNFSLQTGSVVLDRKDVSRIAQDIRNRFPNPDLSQNWKIISVRDRMITVNAGKKDNVSQGMLGFVVKIEQDNGIRRIAYRAKFVVMEVFQDSFNAELVVDEETAERDEYILRTISRDEPIMMK